MACRARKVRQTFAERGGMLSVVVIGKEAAALLPGCLDSIAGALADIAHEVLYVDAASTDASVEIALGRGARVFARGELDNTPAMGRYIGTLEAKGETLLFLDHDMRLQKGFVEAALAVMQGEGNRAPGTGRNPQQLEARDGHWAGATGIREDIFRKGGVETGRAANVFGCTEQREAPVFGGALLIEKEALLRAGGWDPDVPTYEEVELYARLRKHGARVVELPVPMILHIDEQRENRSLWRVLWNRRRLGLGQALVAAIRKGSAGALMRLEWKAFLVWSIDMLSLLLLLVWGGRALPVLLLVQALLFVWLWLSGQRRSYVTYTLLLLYLPAGMLCYHRRVCDYHPIEGEDHA